MAEEPHIQLNNVAFAYGDRPILKDIDLSTPKGVLIAIMGGSGCGKTTLLRLLSGQQRPQHGEVLVGGERVDQMNTALYQFRRKMGMLFQFGARLRILIS
ncbi:MAG: ATP-binding cassette domain-containing protein [Pseudomonadales bacterium]